MKKLNTKLIIWILLILTALSSGFVASVYIFNHFERQKNIYLETTFVDTHQAIVFWKTDTETLGYVTYGDSPGKLDQRIQQTSSVPGFIHTAVIDEIPLDGIYVTVHNESDNFFYWPEPFFIKFDPYSYQE